jgi:glycosyltransferase involved in cell wall biosynthesis
MARILVVSNYRSILSHRPEAEIFIGLRKLGHDITIMTYDDAVYIPRFEDVGIKVIPYHPQSKKDARARALIQSTLRDQQIDFLFLFNSKSIANGLSASRGWSGKVVLYRGCPGNIYWYDPSSYMKHLHPRVDFIICNSQAVKDHLDTALLWRRHKTIVIKKGHQVDWYDDIQPKERSNFSLPDGAFALSYVGNDRRVKGVRYLLESCMHWEKEVPIHLFLFGRGLDREKYLKIARASPFSERIHFMGFQKDAIEWVAGSDAFVLSSIEHESLTKAVVESMCVGTPVIITDIPGNRELLVDGESGLRVPRKDGHAIYQATKRLYQNENLREKLGLNGRQRIEDSLSHKQTVQEYHQFISENSN